MYTDRQLVALQQARALLEGAGLLTSPPGSPNSELTRLRVLLQPISHSLPQASLKYKPPLATIFNPVHILARQN